MPQSPQFDFGFEPSSPAEPEFDFGEYRPPSFEFPEEAPHPPLPKTDEVQVGPQPGPQTLFLETEADIAIYGGAAGGGKTFGLLLEPLRHADNPKFGAVCFRRNSKQVRNEGGLWHESLKLYLPLGGEPKASTLEWVFPSGMRVGFGHLEYDSNVQDWHGSQIPLIMFDELTNFSQYQFFYMLSRNRSDSGVPGYMRATCNPDVDSWVREFISWWIDNDGWAIPERAGVLRWFVQVADKIHWADSKTELVDKFGEKIGRFATSVTFIPAKLSDNQKLLERDPSYEARLMALPQVERLRLLGDERGGNWNVRHTAGSMFRREWFPLVDAVPAGWTACIRFWDRAATPVSPSSPDPDWSRGLKLYKYPDGTWLVGDLKSLRDNPGEVEKMVRGVAEHDGRAVEIMSQRDPGSAGVAEALYFVRMLQGYNVSTEPMHTNKLSRAKPVSAQALARNIKVLRADWNNEFFSELENFPDGKHDDIVDVLSGAFNKLCSDPSILDYM